MTLLIVIGAVVAVALAWWVSQLGTRGPAASPASNAAPGLPSEAEVRRLLAAGHRIEAIKVYRTLTGLGLKEANDAVEAMAAGRSLPAMQASAPRSTGIDAGTDREITRLVQAGQLIEAIKRYRELTGLGLKEAKDAIEKLAR